MKVRKMLLCGLMCGITAVLAQVMIPIGAVPVSLATLGVMLSVSVLGSGSATICQVVYLLAGAIGFPVFHGMQGGVGVLFGPTGGFLFGYLLLAWVGGRLLEKGVPFLVSMATGMLFCYGCGCLWFWIVTKSSLVSIFLICILPFLPGDFLKILLANWFAKRMNGKIF